MVAFGRRSADVEAPTGVILGAPAGSYVRDLDHDPKEAAMLWLVIGIVLLVVAIAGGTIIHPILFVLAILALLAFFAGSRGRARL
jgi:hypothetical protein